ncbi:MAG: helix-turn-helix domain-containing protein [Eubacterium sp.]
MSIKQGEYLKQLRTKNGLSQDALSEILGISRQSISKWEQGNSAPDIENIKKLADYFNVSIDSIVTGEAEGEIVKVEPKRAEKKLPSPPKIKNTKKVRLYALYPVFTAIVYCVLGVMLSSKGWAYGWLVFLTIPLFYSAVEAYERKKPVLFCYPLLVVIAYLVCGLFYSLWHPMWIIFLTIPVYYIIFTKKKK